MLTFNEGWLKFSFGNTWQVIKFDEASFYRHHFTRLDGSKAVDFLGLLNNRDLYFIEVKDFRGYRIENKKKFVDNHLFIEIGQKVKDSIACLIAAYHHNPEQWRPFVKALQNTHCPIKIVLWLEQDELLNLPIDELKSQLSNYSKALGQKTRWLTPKVFVINQSILNKPSNLPDLIVQNLPYEISYKLKILVEDSHMYKFVQSLLPDDLLREILMIAINQPRQMILGNLANEYKKAITTPEIERICLVFKREELPNKLGNINLFLNSLNLKDDTILEAQNWANEHIIYLSNDVNSLVAQLTKLLEK